jgi:hypothetical protein
MIQFASIVFSHASFESPQAPLVKKKVQLLMYRLIALLRWLLDRACCFSVRERRFQIQLSA